MESFVLRQPLRTSSDRDIKHGSLDDSLGIAESCETVEHEAAASAETLGTQDTLAVESNDVLGTLETLESLSLAQPEPPTKPAINGRNRSLSNARKVTDLPVSGKERRHSICSGMLISALSAKAEEEEPGQLVRCSKYRYMGTCQAEGSIHSIDDNEDDANRTESQESVAKSDDGPANPFNFASQIVEEEDTSGPSRPEIVSNRRMSLPGRSIASANSYRRASLSSGRVLKRNESGRSEEGSWLKDKFKKMSRTRTFSRSRAETRGLYQACDTSNILEGTYLTVPNQPAASTAASLQSAFAQLTSCEDSRDSEPCPEDAVLTIVPRKPARVRLCWDLVHDALEWRHHENQSGRVSLCSITSIELARIADEDCNCLEVKTVVDVFYLVESPAFDIKAWHQRLVQARQQVQESLQRVIDCPAFNAKYCIANHLGQGGYSFIKMVERRNAAGQKAVAKFIDRKKVTKLTERGVPMEIELLMSLNDENVVQVEEFFECSSHYIMIMELHGRGRDLFDYIEEYGPLPEASSKIIFRQIATGVNYLVSNGVIHGDLKDENVIIDDDALGVKIIDFGSAMRFKEGEKWDIFCGTMRNGAPEIHNGIEYDPVGQEIWSLGIILFLLLFATEPFEDERMIKLGIYQLPGRTEMEIYPSDDALDLLSKILERNPEERLPLADILRHPWLA